MRKSLVFFYRNDNHRAHTWAKELTQHVRKRYPSVTIGGERPTFVIALGGDGTILEATRNFGKRRAIIVGLNLGHVGFLASARRPREFIAAIDALLTGKYTVSKRMMVTATLMRKGKAVHHVDALNEISLQSLAGAMKLTVSIDGYPLQFVHGNGVLVSTPTGSTAYNLSAHGPIVTPDLRCFIVTELLDHHIPTPPIVVKRTKTITIDVTEIRAKKMLAIAATGELVDAVLWADDTNIFPLAQGDHIEIGRSTFEPKFAEFSSGYFYRSLQEKFAFR